jgi:Mg-chelatase subunit ChlD
MSLEFPWGLLGLLGLPFVWWLHRGARPRGDHPFTAFFLLPAGAGEGRGGPRVRAPWVLAARCVALLALSGAAAGLAVVPSAGTLVLTDGPLQLRPEWSTPVTLVRAGNPPTLAASAGEVAPVAGPRDWGGALLLGRRHAPEAPLVRHRATLDGGRIVGAGAAIDGGRVIVTAAVSGTGAPRLRIGDQHHDLSARNGDFALRAELPPGPALVEGVGDPWPVCIPDAAPLRVASEGWPPAVEALLRVLPGVDRVASEGADWRPGPSPAAGAGWAAFAPTHTTFEFRSGDPARRPAPLWFPGPLPPPGAVARSWRPLDRPGVPSLLAADAVVADQREGPAGRARRFGFLPSDTDLPETAGWPILFHDAALADRAARSRCRIHRAGQPLLLQAAAAVTVTDPTNGSRRLTPRDGRLLVAGLDQQGVWRLESDGVTAHLAVQQPQRASSVDLGGPHPLLRTPPTHGTPLRWPWLLAAALALAAVAWASARRHPLAWGAVALTGLGLFSWRVGADGQGRVVVAVDTSASMPQAETAAALARLEAALGAARFARVEGDTVVRRGGDLVDPPAWGDAAETRHGPLLHAAAELAGPGGVVVLLSDGRAADGPVPVPRPVFALPAVAAGPDGALRSARALRLGGALFVRARLSVDRPASGRVELAGLPVPVTLTPGGSRTVQAVIPKAPDAETVWVRLHVEGDRNPTNDALPVPVEGAEAGRAIVIGPAGLPWARAAGLSARSVPPEALLDGGGQVASARALLLHDVPAGVLPPAVLPRLRRWVEAGGVLVLAGRERAFGPGGWAGTPLDALSPLASDPRPPGSGRLAAVLLLDHSGSMASEAGGIGAEGVARVGAALAAALAPDDALGVVAFAARATTLLAARPVSELGTRALPVPSVARGGSRLAPALAAAHQALISTPAEARVLLLVTDGQFVDPEAAEPGAERLAAAGVRVFAIQVGEAKEVAAPLQQLAARTGGEARVALAREVPRLVVASAASGQTGLMAPGGGVSPEPPWSGRVGGEPPPVASRVRVRARAQARVLARAGGEPLLAEWAIGRGQVIALATDAWPLAADQWATLLAPAAAPPPGDVTVQVVDGALQLRTPATDPPPRGAIQLTTPDGERHTTRWRPTGPGRASAPLPKGPVQVLDLSFPSTRGAVLARVTRPPGAELRQTGVDPGALALQAELTGGALLAGPDAVGPVLAARRPRGGIPGARLFALLAALATLLEALRWAGRLPTFRKNPHSLRAEET